jgi:hypothetical protein
MATTRSLSRLDPERRRRRIQVLAELAEAHALRDRLTTRRARLGRVRELVVNRRRMA